MSRIPRSRDESGPADQPRSDADSEGRDAAEEAIYQQLAGMAQAMDPRLREDVLQEAALRMIRAHRRGATTSHSYLWLVLRSALADAQRAKIGERSHVAEVPGGDTTAESVARGELRRLLRLLPVEEGEVLELRYLRGLTSRESVAWLRARRRIATVRAVDSRLRRARVKFRRVLAAHGYAVSMSDDE